MSPTPGRPHNDLLMALFRQLDAGCPAGGTIDTPCDYRLPDDNELVPDIMVVRRDDVGDRRITVPPLLAVEVISPRSRWMDPAVERANYRRRPCRPPGSATLPRRR